MSSALTRLRDRLPQLSGTERAAAERILAEPKLVADSSVQELAQRTFSSPSTIVRMCVRAGYSGYKEFRREVTFELARREQSLRNTRQELQRTDSPEEIARKITCANILSLQQTLELLDMEMLRLSVEVLHRAQVIYFFGTGASRCAAMEAYGKLLRLNRLCVFSEDRQSQLVQSWNATARDAALVFADSAAEAELTACMKNLKHGGVPIIAIVPCTQSPVSELADYRLHTADSQSLFQPSAVAQLNVADILFAVLANADYERSVAQLARTRMGK